ncbi:probable serine threonine- kinase DDB_G0271682, partial [Paramuricea clavata]
MIATWCHMINPIIDGNHTYIGKGSKRVIEIGSQDRGLGPEIQQVERHKEETIDVTSKMQPVMLDENIDLTEIELFQDMHITDLTSENQYLQEGNARVTTDMKQEEDINLHAEIERLKEENSNLIAEMQRHIAENDDIKKENSNLETINKLLQEDNTTFQQMNLPPMLGLQLRGLQFLEMKRLEQEKSNLVKQVQELREEKIEKSNETRQLTDDNSNTKNEIWKVRQENHQLQQQKSEFDNKNQKLQKEKSQLDDENQQLRQEKDQTDNENQQLRQEKDQLVNENKQLRQGKNQLDNENLQLRQDKSQLDNDNQQLRQDKSQLENDIQQLRQDKSQLDNENQQLHRETAEISIELRKIRQENNNMQIEIGQYRADTMPSIITESGSVVVSNDLLGKGAWGAVWAGDFFGTKVAVKEYYEIILSPHNLNLLQREINIASYCRHPNLLQFICATKNHQNHLLIVTELMDKALRALVEQHASERSRLEYQEIKLISVDVARGLNYLHSKKPKPIIHRDISSANVLLSTENGAVRRAKISDYGSAKFMEKCNTANPGSAIYAAPEANQAKQDPKEKPILLNAMFVPTNSMKMIRTFQLIGAKLL